jgi:acetyl-CoA acetyltransferase
MELGSDQYPDPFRDAMQDLVHRAVQVGSFAVTGTQVYGYHRRTQARIAAEQDHQARRALNAQIRAERDADRARWEPALDPGWLRRTHILEAAQAWGAALPYADRGVPWYDPAAANAMIGCEERLRSLHPYAMARYDRLRSDGLEPAEAMQEAAPLFARHPYARDAPSVPRQMLEAATARQTDAPAAGTSAGPVPAEGTRAVRPCDEDFPLPIRDVLAAQAGSVASRATEAPATRAVPHPSQRDRRP